MQAVPGNTQVEETVQVADTTLSTIDSLQVDTTGDVSGTLPQVFKDAGTLVSEGRFSEAGNDIATQILIWVTDLAPKIAGALLVLVIFYTAYRVLYNLLRRILRRSNVVQPGLQTLVLQAFRLLSIVLIAITVLQTIGIDPAALIAGIGVAGIAFGFAARDTVENILSGVSILTDKAFRIGDTLIVNGTYCVVENITLRTTRLRTPKNEVLVIPNQQMANEQILNHTIGGVLRIEIPFSIAYKESPQEARRVILEITKHDTRLMEDPEPQVVVTNLNDSSVDLSLWVYVENPKEERQIIYHYTEAIKGALNKAGIEIPFPHIQLVQD
ncbi:MAG: mechanosensitive ion channel [Rhodothermaceae bacterium]|nr:mechanosensitive ion channel family protein [Bacteroidota bacterium]MXW14646.1 mechanosensitive ion channel [Rhodothermaceae bacterium]MDE2646123.1 mechanosensitive ion channel family protein [Bacteroidota bacterium]MXW34058.1 mechanosensitive ion channel [Rhodothermaceae bacterium]MXX96891.1 mechanosensitive ion channel [Rhodothermaceae bacterium]